MYTAVYSVKCYVFTFSKPWHNELGSQFPFLSENFHKIMTHFKPIFTDSVTPRNILLGTEPRPLPYQAGILTSMSPFLYDHDKCENHNVKLFTYRTEGNWEPHTKTQRWVEVLQYSGSDVVEVLQCRRGDVVQWTVHSLARPVAACSNFHAGGGFTWHGHIAPRSSQDQSSKDRSYQDYQMGNRTSSQKLRVGSVEVNKRPSHTYRCIGHMGVSTHIF